MSFVDDLVRRGLVFPEGLNVLRRARVQSAEQVYELVTDFPGLKHLDTQARLSGVHSRGRCGRVPDGTGVEARLPVSTSARVAPPRHRQDGQWKNGQRAVALRPSGRAGRQGHPRPVRQGLAGLRLVAPQAPKRGQSFWPRFQQTGRPVRDGAARCPRRRPAPRPTRSGISSTEGALPAEG